MDVLFFGKAILKKSGMHYLRCKMDKTEILSRTNVEGFYKNLIPSFVINGKSEALGPCPFHKDTHPSLSVNRETGLYRCFACGAKGDIFNFYMQFKGVDFPTALREIAA